MTESESRHAPDLADDFVSSVAEFDLETLENNGSSVCGIRSDFTIAYRNRAWHRFARQNDGADALARWGLGADLLTAISEPLRMFYRANFERCLGDRQVWHHEYECSSPQLRRRFRMSTYPTPSGTGLLSVHALLVEEPVRARAFSPVAERYADARGLLHQCMHCRCYRRSDDENQWDWIPAWVSEPPPNTSHGFCRVCFDYHLPRGLDQPTAVRDVRR